MTAQAICKPVGQKNKNYQGYIKERYFTSTMILFLSLMVKTLTSTLFSRSDVLGQFMPLVGKDWTQSGVARLFSAIKVHFLLISETNDVNI